MVDDRTLLSRIARGDDDGFRTFYDRHARRVYGIALNVLRDVGDAEEVTQDVFVEVHRAAGSFRGDARVSTWLHRIALRKAIDRDRHRTRARRFARVTHRLGFGPDPDAVQLRSRDHPGVDLDHRQAARALFDLIDGLPDRQRKALLLSYVEDLTRQDAADAMGIGLKALESLLQRGKATLRRRIDERRAAEGSTDDSSSKETE